MAVGSTSDTDLTPRELPAAMAGKPPEDERRPLAPRAERLAASDPRQGPPWADLQLEGALRAGAALFDDGRFFDAHEAWEGAWHHAPPAERAFFQGLVHAAAACLHHQRGNAHGLGAQRGRMVARLGSFAPRHRRVDVAGLITAVMSLRVGVDAGYPRLRLSA